jgi:cation/acetate symporter
LITCIVLVASSPVVSGSDTALFTDADWSWFPLANPGIISIPAGFFFGWLGSVTSNEPTAEARFEELEVRSLTGSGAEAAVHH